MITLRQMTFFIAIAEEMSFTRAAARCHVTQPTLSAGLRELEDRLGVKLVERTSRSILITEVGEGVLVEARGLLDGARRIETLAKAHLNPEEGDLRLGAIPTIGPYLLPRAIPEIRGAFPRLRVFMREEMTESLLEGVESGRLDLALIALPFETGALATMPLFSDGYHLATPEIMPLEDAKRDLDLLLLERGHCLQRHALAAVDASVFRRNTHFEATSLPTLIAMVGEGLGMTLLPDLAVRTGVAEEQRVRLTSLPDACPRRVALVWRRTTSRAKTFRTIGEVLRHCARSGGASEPETERGVIAPAALA
jgi:LysR family transcriptional regulator, hydrogen peroxide-inducible genes activator